VNPESKLFKTNCNRSLSAVVKPNPNTPMDRPSECSKDCFLDEQNPTGSS
jgi:hypothetical protein